VDVSPDGLYAVTASGDGTARIWQIGADRPRLALPGSGAVFLSGGEKTATWERSSAAIWETRSGKRLWALNGHTDEIADVAINSEANLILTVSKDGTARLWDTSTGAFIRRLDAGIGPLLRVTMSRDGSLAALASENAMVEVYDVRQGVKLSTLSGHRGTINSMMFSSDGSRLLTASDDGTVCVWKCRGGSRPLVYRRFSGAVKRATFTPDDRLIVSASVGTGNITSFAWDGEPVRIWNSEDGLEARQLKGHADFIADAILSRDGRLVLTASYDQTARVWDLGTGRVISELRGSREAVERGSFSRDGKFAATTGGDCSLRLWETRSGRSLGVFGGPDASSPCFTSAEFDATGTSVLAASFKGIMILPCEVCVSTGKLAALAKQRVKRDLLPTERATYLH
jgi:WD40 repeat protein